MAQPTPANTRLYRHGKLVSEGFPIADVSDHLDEDDAVIWFDLCSPSEEELAAISEELGLHELAIRSVLTPNQRPKLDMFDTHMFLNVFTAHYDGDTGQLDLTEASAFITSNALVTVRTSDRFDLQEITNRWDSSSGLAEHGVAFLLHGVLDYVVDTHFEVVQAMDEQIEVLEDRLFDEQIPDRDQQRRTFGLRQSLVTFRRVVSPMRDIVNALFRRNDVIRDSSITPYFQDVYDHVLRASEWTDSLRDLVGNIREAHMTMQSNRMNLIMKRVTSWAAIIAVPTAITGFYGQNVPYPGSQQMWGFWTSTAIWAIAALVLYFQFRKRDWL
ncbi:magnesium transporter CorA family protein [Acrocarpospora macrocephala]|uniref:Magnesium transporter CorA n=1 Tax=Acrocarpospora macrocephala TaxID=150177 RepID=A0A5M3WLC5_9ACTN|nr:magnesium transporter CorA family protein [Acrocarpospora macrocephala]GES10077.1 magnesium transporter CorA [Acrocarpospora macrocephala]